MQIYKFLRKAFFIPYNLGRLVGALDGRQNASGSASAVLGISRRIGAVSSSTGWSSSGGGGVSDWIGAGGSGGSSTRSWVDLLAQESSSVLLEHVEDLGDELLLAVGELESLVQLVLRGAVHQLTNHHVDGGLIEKVHLSLGEHKTARVHLIDWSSTNEGGGGQEGEGSDRSEFHWVSRKKEVEDDGKGKPGGIWPALIYFSPSAWRPG